MTKVDSYRAFRAMEDRQLDQLIGLAEGLTADGIVNQSEAEALKTWLERNPIKGNPLVARLMDQVETVLADGVLDAEEASDLHDTLVQFAVGDSSDGEELKTSGLPLCPEPRQVCIPGNSFVFTGTGVFGTRREMWDVTERAGGIVHKSVVLDTRYVVLGTYVTPAWRHQTFGRKIEKAMEYRDHRRTGLSIVHEEDWKAALGPSPQASWRAERTDPDGRGRPQRGET